MIHRADKQKRLFFIHSIDPVRWILLMMLVRPFFRIVCFRYRSVREIGFRRLRADTITYHEFSECMKDGVTFAQSNNFGTVFRSRLNLGHIDIEITNQIAKQATNYIKDMLIAAEILSKSDNAGVFIIDTGIIRPEAGRDEFRQHFRNRSGLDYREIPLLNKLDGLIKIVAVFAFQLVNVLKNSVKSISNNAHKYHHKIIYNDLTPTDMNLNADEELSTTFLFDDNGLSKEDVVFIAHDREKSREWRNNGYLVVGSIHELLDFTSSILVAIQFFRVFFLNFRLVYGNISFIQTVIKTDQIILIDTIIRHLDLRGMIYSVSSIGNGPVEALPFMANDKPVVLFLYSSNVNVLPYYTYLNCTHLIVWNQYTKKVIEWHPQTHEIRIIPVGPVMMADDDLTEERIRSTKKHYSADQGDSQFNIGVFDIAPPRPALLERIRCPSAYTKDFHRQFMFDIFRLSEEFDDVKLLIKPKRWSQHHSIDDRVLDYLAGNEEKVALLPPQINPYLAIVMCDLVICMPFSSPLIAAWQKGIPGFYYAPLDQEQYYPVEPLLSTYIIKGYRDLQREVRSAIEDSRSNHTSVQTDLNLTGIEGNRSVSARFRACLTSIFDG